MHNIHDKGDRLDVLVDAYGSYQAIMDVLETQQNKLAYLKAKLHGRGQDLLMVVENERVALQLIGSRLSENQQRVIHELESEHVMS